MRAGNRRVSLPARLHLHTAFGDAIELYGTSASQSHPKAPILLNYVWDGAK